MLSQASGCGNDFASEKPMARKIIVESAKNLVELYDIDGFRFDLMGLLDIETMRILADECRKIKSDLVFYGEGWNMDANYQKAKKACSECCFIAGLGFFKIDIAKVQPFI